LKYYLDFLKKPNKDNSYAMALAANLSGKAINISKTTAPHAVSYPFTSLYGISHGHAVSLTLEKFFYFNFVNSNKSNANFDLNQRFKMIFNLSNVANINDFTSFILNIKKNLKLESNYKNLGVDIDQNLSRIISSISIQRLSNNPIELNKNDLKYILLSK
jgi:alcohol dehydrogenase class IV